MKTLSLLLAVSCSVSLAAPPVVSNIRASQRPGTKLVDVYYDLSDADGDLQLIQMAVSADAGLSYSIPCPSLSGHAGAGISAGANRKITWNAGVDWNGNWVPQCRVRVTAFDGTTPVAPAGMALIPGGPFQMGDNLDGMTDAMPVHNVQVDAFFMDKTEVTFALWQQVQAWGNANGYSIGGGGGKAANHPVHSMNWYHAVQWCNARSEREGLTPCYYTDVAHTIVYKTGYLDLENTMVKWNANGYRLPTEAEWEKAARGGRTGQRYPWGDEISSANANYRTDGNPWIVGSFPWSSPVGSYPANGYGLFDVAGNFWEWTWDWYSESFYGSTESFSNPLGSTSGGGRTLRGGSVYFAGDDTYHMRAATRSGAYLPLTSQSNNGLRTVRR